MGTPARECACKKEGVSERKRERKRERAFVCVRESEIVKDIVGEREGPFSRMRTDVGPAHSLTLPHLPEIQQQSSTDCSDRIVELENNPKS